MSFSAACKAPALLKKRTSRPKGLISPVSDGTAEAVPFVLSFFLKNGLQHRFDDNVNHCQDHSSDEGCAEAGDLQSRGDLAGQDEHERIDH
jgi:hypothetical protein